MSAEQNEVSEEDNVTCFKCPYCPMALNITWLKYKAGTHANPGSSWEMQDGGHIYGLRLSYGKSF